MVEGQYVIVNHDINHEEEIPSKHRSMNRRSSVETMVNDERGVVRFSAESLLDNEYSLANSSNPSVLQSNIESHANSVNSRQSL